MIPDWCEPNYTWSQYVAEWWNTWSSLLYVLAGLHGLRALASAGQKRYRLRRIYICLWSLVSVGIGSTLFHSTLSRTGQIADEVSMIICIHAGLLVTARSTRAKILVGSGLTLCIVTYFKSGFYTFTLVISGTLIYLTARSRTIMRDTTNQTARTLCKAGVVCFASGFLFFWLPEHLFCVISPLPERGALQRVPLHATWHLLTAIGAYLWIMASLLHELTPSSRVHPLHPTLV